MNKFMTEEHWENLPTIRISKVVIENFKNVEHGEVVFNCGRKFVPYNTEADILGIYGQNGSGKTALIEALSVPNVYSECIAIGKEFAKLEFLFDLQYESGVIRELNYSFKMKRKELTDEELKEEYKNAPDGFPIPEDETKVVVFDEKIVMLWENASKRQTVIDTSSSKDPFVPVAKRKELAGGGNDRGHRRSS